MTKKLIIVWLTLIMILFSSISIYADEEVQGNFFEKHIIINGEEITNYNLQYPFLLYNNTTYFPVTEEICEILDITADMDWESRTLKLLKTDSTRKNISSDWVKNDSEPVKLRTVSGIKVITFECDNREAHNTANEIIDKEVITAPDINIKKLDLSGNPVLASGSRIFLPVKSLTSEDSFGWSVYFDPYYGICISTDPDVSAETYCDKAESLKNRGLADYIMSRNGSLTPSIAQKYVFNFKRAQKVCNVDEKLLIAIASRESGFNRYATSPCGARGMMQVMPATGARAGLSSYDLYDAEKSINFGAGYIGKMINAYSGNIVKGLSAYNQGAGRVNRGNYSTAYASRVLSEYNRIIDFLSTNGYA